MHKLSLNDVVRDYFSPERLTESPEILEKSLRLMQQWLFEQRAQPYPVMPLQDLKAEFKEFSLPQQGECFDQVFQQLEQTVFAHSIQLNHPRFIGHMTQALPWIAVLAEAFIATLNQNQVKIETAYVSTLIEKQVLGWLHAAIYQQSADYYSEVFLAQNQTLGNLVSGGTVGNLTALAVALERQLPGVRKHGLFETLQNSSYRGLAVLGSARIHYSVKKALASLGLGENALHCIPVDVDNQIDLDALNSKIEELKSQQIKIVALIGIAGTTETGNIDPLSELADIAQREDIWFHVDAAWGGALVLSETARALFAGIERADSVVIDGHKLFWVTMAQSMVLFKDAESLQALKHHANYIIRSRSEDLGQTSLEGSRRFDALKLWLSFKCLGLDGYQLLLDQSARLSQSMQSLITEHPDFELISKSDTFILTYRYFPAAWQTEMQEFQSLAEHEKIAALNLRLNGLNASLQNHQKQAGNSFVSRTILESTGYAEEITVLRVVLSNVLTTQQDLTAVLNEQCQIAQELLRSNSCSDENIKLYE